MACPSNPSTVSPSKREMKPLRRGCGAVVDTQVRYPGRSEGAIVTMGWGGGVREWPGGAVRVGEGATRWSGVGG